MFVNYLYYYLYAHLTTASSRFGPAKQTGTTFLCARCTKINLRSRILNFETCFLPSFPPCACSASGHPLGATVSAWGVSGHTRLRLSEVALPMPDKWSSLWSSRATIDGPGLDLPVLGRPRPARPSLASCPTTKAGAWYTLVRIPFHRGPWSLNTPGHATVRGTPRLTRHICSPSRTAAPSMGPVQEDLHAL